jgi:hypothetical protein
MQEEIMLACVGQNGNRAAGVADRTKEMEVGPFTGRGNRGTGLERRSM